MFSGKISNTFDGVISQSSNLPHLPLTHKVDYYRAKTILKDECITTSFCDVFSDDLVYLFYGRPSYAVAQEKSPRKEHASLPVCFIVKNFPENIDSIFPFDSGAYDNKFFEGFIHENMHIFDFALPLDIEYIKRFISTFYHSNDNYYKDCAIVEITSLKYNASEDLELEAYINILLNKGAVKFDSRATTIEIITHDNVDLLDNLQAIILPFDVYRTNDKIKKFEQSGVDIITYPTFGDAPNSYNGVIKDKMYTYLNEKGLL